MQAVESKSQSVEMIDPVQYELEYRRRLWTELLNAGGPKGLGPNLLRQLGVYGGAQGVWVDKARTHHLTAEGTGVTVGLLHTGSSYADDLSEDGVLYHYPKTRRASAHDRNEIDATKACRNLGLPVFVITYPYPNASSRDLHLGWVEDWDDSATLFLITFSDSFRAPPVEVTIEEAPFELVEKPQRVMRQAAARQGQQRFKFRVLQRYGVECAVCGLTVAGLLDAAHLRPKNLHGTDDPRNGLVLCALHHRAFDAGLFAIEPNTLILHFRIQGPSASALRITNQTIEHLPLKPHIEALEWHWLGWMRSSAV